MEDAEHTEPWLCGVSEALRGEGKRQEQALSGDVRYLKWYAKSKVKESRCSRQGGKSQGLAA